MSERRKIKVDLCHDHFERLVDGNTCATCPSRHKNESVVRAMSAVLEADGDKVLSAVVNELKTIRAALAENQKLVRTLTDKMQGNGKPGIETRLALLESYNHQHVDHRITTLEAGQNSRKDQMALIIAALAGLAGIGSLLFTLAS